MARWRSGDAADCKSVHPGSIPGRASTSSKIPYALFKPKRSKAFASIRKQAGHGFAIARRDDSG